MNLLETYVSNITNVEEIKDKTGKLSLFKVTADFDCYGSIEIQITKNLGKHEYDSVLEKGYYLS